MTISNLNKKIISAGDLESYAYCPVSLCLKKKGFKQDRDHTERGILLHNKMTGNINNIRKMEKKAHTIEQYISPLAIWASIISIIAIIFHPTWNADIWRDIFLILSLIWLLHALFFFYKAEKIKNKKLRPKYEIVILLSAMISTIIALFSLSELLPSETTISRILSLLALCWLMCSNILFYISSRYLEESLLKRKEYKIKRSRIDYVDYGKSNKLLVSKRYGLSGRPDYIISDKKGRHMPVEIKTGVKPRYPYFSHIVQIGVYGFLVEDLYGYCPGGLLRYKDKTFFIELDEKLGRTIKEIRINLLNDLKNGSMHRNHERRGKCKNCSMRENCPEKIY